MLSNPPVDYRLRLCRLALFANPLQLSAVSLALVTGARLEFQWQRHSLTTQSAAHKDGLAKHVCRFDSAFVFLNLSAMVDVDVMNKSSSFILPPASSSTNDLHTAAHRDTKEIVYIDDDADDECENGTVADDANNAAGQPATIPNMEEMINMIANGPLTKMKSETSKSSPGISMPGFSTIFGDAHLSRRIVWAAVVTCVITIATIQVKDRVQFYFSTPVTVNVRVTMNESLRFPVLTLCNKNIFNVSQIKRLQQEMMADHDIGDKNVTLTGKIDDLIGFRNMDVAQVWDSVAHNVDRIITECWFGRNITCSQVGKWNKVYTYMGVCYSFVRNDRYVHTTGMFNNLYVKLRETEDEYYQKENGWKILIHDQRDSPTIDIRTHGSTLDNGWGKDIRIYMRDFQTLDTWKRPCVKDGNYSKCIATCFAKSAVANMTCNLPFIDPLGHLRMCSDPRSYADMVQVVERLLFQGQWTSNNCTHCRRQCDQDIYVAYTEMTQMKPHEKKVSKMRLFYQDFTFDEIEESADYGAVSLLCDIGGSLGFLLGFSVLTVFEIVDAIVQACLASARSVAGKCIGNKRRP